MKSINQITKLLLLGVLSLALAITACKKDDNSTPSNTDLLTKSAWKITSLTVDPAFPIFDENFNITGYTNDLLSIMEDCSKDDTFKFNSDNTLKYDEGASKCDPSDPQSSNETWSFKTNETILSFTSDGMATDYNIVTLTESTLKITYSETLETTTFSFTMTFSH